MNASLANASTAAPPSLQTPVIATHDATPGAALDATPDAAPVPGAWPFWQRLAFRYLLLHYVLYAFPRPLSCLLETLGGLFTWVAKEYQQTWLTENPFRWAGKWAKELDKIDAKWWQPVTSWMDAHRLAPYEVIHQQTGSGDTGHDFARLIAIVVASLVLTSIWSALARGNRGYPRLGRWLHLVVRFDLAFWMFTYGFSKFYGGQFGQLELTRMTQEIGDLRPMTMVGTFMQGSRPYELFGAAGEVLSGLLLFHRRTALLGACLASAVMTHVDSLNWMYGVPVKLFSTHLLVFAVCLLAPFRARLCQVFVSNRLSPPVDIAVVKSRWAAWPLAIAGTAWVFATLWIAHVTGMAPRPWMQGREKTALYGLWVVDQMSLDGHEVPGTDATRWHYFAIDRGTMAWVREAGGQRRTFEFKLDESAGTAAVKERSRAGGDTESWTYVCETKMVPVDVPLLLRNPDRTRKVDGERRTLVLKGKWGGKSLELYAVEKLFRLQTGFRLRQELPDFW